MGTDGDDKNNLDTLKTIGRTARAVARNFPDGVKLALEFNWSPVMKSLRSASIVVEEADDPRVGILFDPAHFYCTPSKFEDLTPQVVGRIVHVHVDDMRDKPGDRSDCNGDRVLPGEGVVGVKRLIDHLEAHGYRGMFSIEMFNAELWAMPAVVAATKMYEAMKNLTS
jgi:sugar phosphate isomerase/epimerase